MTTPYDAGAANRQHVLRAGHDDDEQLQPQQQDQGTATIKKKRMVIDSRARNHAAYPTPARYEVTLDEDLFNVRSVSLTVADVPFPAYLIGPRRTSVPFLLADGTTACTAALAAGNYASPDDLASELTSAMAAAATLAESDQTFAVEYVSRTDGFAVRSSAPFTLAFAGRCKDTPACVLGFGTASDYASRATDAAHSVVAPFRRDFKPDRYVVLKLSPNAEVLTSVSQALDRTFAVIPITSDLNIVSEDAFIKRWTPPIARVGRVGVEFTDAHGQPYDFQNQDHRIELTFEVVGPPAWR